MATTSKAVTAKKSGGGARSQASATGSRKAPAKRSGVQTRSAGTPVPSKRVSGAASASKTTTPSSARRELAAKSPAAKRAAEKKQAAKKVIPRSQSGRSGIEAATSSARSSRASSRGSGTPPKSNQAAIGGVRKAREPRGITPEQALANTQALLEQKKQHERAAPAYPGADRHAKPDLKQGFMDQDARDRAREQELGNLQYTALHGFAEDTNRRHH